MLADEFGVDKPLRVAFSCSGGGNRALIGTLGIFKAAARHKFLDVATYLTGLSGSTWIIAPWSYMYLHGLLDKNYERSLEQFEEMLIEALSYKCKIGAKGICIPDNLEGAQAHSFSNHLTKRFGYNQHITAVDLYGAMVGNFALAGVGENRLDVTWSSLDSLAQKGDIPLPICSSVFDLKQSRATATGYRTEYEWFESGPFEAGSKELGYIPVWALGSEFENGSLIFHAPEYPLSFFLGIYGSAFAISPNDIIDKGLPKVTVTVEERQVTLPLDTWVRKLLDTANSDIRSQRSELIHAQFSNYSEDLPTSALKDNKTLGMFDGGMYFNIPLPLLFDRPERDVDVVIMYDSNPADVPALVDATRYFKRKRMNMPDMEHVTKEGLLSKPMTVFNDPREASYNSLQPTLIYFPTPKTDISKPPYSIDTTHYPNITAPIDNSKAPYITPNFKYSSAELKNLADTMDAIFESQVNDMKDIIRLVSDKKRDF